MVRLVFVSEMTRRKKIIFPLPPTEACVKALLDLWQGRVLLIAPSRGKDLAAARVSSSSLSDPLAHSVEQILTLERAMCVTLAV